MKLTSYFTSSLADTVTPLGMYLRVRDKYPGSILLESTDSHAQESCMTYIGIDPIAGFRAKGKQVHYWVSENETSERLVESHREVLSAFAGFMDQFEVNVPADFPDKIANGFFGYASFDAVQYFEDITLDSVCDEARSIPDLFYQVYRFVIVVDHFRHRKYIVINSDKEEGAALEELSALERILNTSDVLDTRFELEGEEVSNMSEKEHESLIECCKRHIARGDVFQIVPSRRFSQGYRGDDLLVYRVLRSINPSPYLFYFDYGSFRLIGSSPEAELITAGGKAMLYPIAGTYKRTGDDVEDAKKVEELKEDPKENAEHVMLVDLARNDLSRFCHDVHVAKLKSIKYFSHVIHLESEVVGTLTEDTKVVDLLAATFPAGTLSGAPKYRAMELIDKYEPDARSFYGGAVGMIDFNGQDSTHAIMIRTMLSKNKKLFFQAGGGVVADSVVKTEVQETKNKLGALRQALIAAQQLTEQYDE